MPAFRITIAYDGTEFVGWQRQASGTSVQWLLEQILADLAGAPVDVTGAGRTDAGVHALGQVAGFRLDKAIRPDTLVRALNARLPEAVRVTAADEVPDTFHARFAARAKTYRYQLWNGEVMPPIWRRFAWHVPGPLDVGAMDAAAGRLQGRHDFAAFQSAGSAVASTERTIESSRVEVEAGAPADHANLGRMVVYLVTGDGFLRHMVRAIVGTLVDIGRGRRDPAWIADVVTSGDRAQAGATAPAHGLFLMAVRYDEAAGLVSPRPSTRAASRLRDGQIPVQ